MMTTTCRLGMQTFIEAIDLSIWEAIGIRPYVPSMVAGNTTTEKPRENWSEEERRRVQYNLKAKNIIISVLGVDEYFRVSNCKDTKSDEGIFLGYSLQSRAYRVYNKRTMIIEEFIHVSFDDSNAIPPRKDILDDIAESLEQMHIHGQEKEKEKEAMRILMLMKPKQMMILQENGNLLEIIPLTTSLVISKKG